MPAALPLLLDDPPGTALGTDLSGRVVVTGAQGTPYLWDVLEARPLALIVRDDPGDLTPLLAHLHLDKEFMYLGPRLEYLPLSTCERRALRLLAFGLSNAQIAARSGIRLSTVNSQVAAVLAKLNVPSRHAARALYWGHPFPPPSSRQLRMPHP
ncbi:helix-turn-helix transcriptional regulator [Deinococcus murrayi]|uniref:helix-turn-helix transcriptional regulator n=1 Tax=Deinococcus murrayi TaxID=68910 RepID=UPI000686112B|nr:helix-turn-helix transcriptional regulator [Deinococcus murrayi]